MNDWPKISIVTPSYNQAAFLEETIDSVLGQNYPHLEYIVIDGGSTDGSSEIIRKHEKHLAYWQSCSDGGQADAIAQGFRRATGGILAWINSDDFYLPGALRYVARQLDPSREQLLFGNCFHFTEGKSRGNPSDVVLKHARHRLDLIDYLIQPSTFWTRRLADKLGEIDTGFQYVLDWDWFIRAQRAGADFLPSPRYFSAYRLHPEHKSARSGDKRFQEIREIYSRYQPPGVLAAVDACHADYPRLDRWRRRFRRWPLFKKAPPESFLKRLGHPGLQALAAEDLRDILDMIADCHT
jgi:glycosyltransferase involved in cell wall biosynthesis